MNNDAKVIFSPQLANFLLLRGFQIIKLKPKHQRPDETVYVFKLDNGLLQAIEDWMKQGQPNTL